MKKHKLTKRILSGFLSVAMAAGFLTVPVLADEPLEDPDLGIVAADEEVITFKTLGTDWPDYNPISDSEQVTDPSTFTDQAFNQQLTYSKDMPVFDGVPEHLDAFLETYLDWVGLEGALLYTAGLRDSYRMVLDESSPAYGKLIPGGLAAADNANGISANSAPTDFGTFSSQGTTWNPDLMRNVGTVIGKEKMITLQTQINRNRNRHNSDDWSRLVGTTSATIAFGVLTDMHVNPLAGRADEGYGEDVYHMGTLANAQAEGFVGYNDGKASNSGSTDDQTFYTRAVLATKHPSVYTTEWFRTTGNNSVGARQLYEWQIAGTFKGLESGAIMGGMTSFGRTNGIANELSSYNILYNQISKYGYYSSPDFSGENHLFASGTGNSMGNGYDSGYLSDRAHAILLMALANTESVRAMGRDQSEIAEMYALMQQGVYGMTEADVRNSAKGLLAAMVRAGLFDEVDSDGFPVHYPYVDESRDGTDDDYKANNANGTVQEHIDTTLQASQEGIVVLKSDGRLPSAGDRIAVAGHYADTRYVPQTAYSSTVSYERIDYSGVTPLFAMASLYKDAGVTTPSEKIHFSQGAQVVTIEDYDGRLLTAPANDAGGALTFEAPLAGDAAVRQQFEVFDMNQDAIYLRSVYNDRWVTNGTSPANTTAQATNNFVLTTDLDNLVMSSTNKVTSTVTRLGRIRLEEGVYALYSGYSDAYTSTAFRMLESTASGEFTSTGSNTFETDMDVSALERRFKFNEVAGPGAEAISVVDDAQAALVFVGAHARHSAGEGKDRGSMAMGSTDYQLVKEVAAAYAAQNKPVIVVVRSSYVQLMQDPVTGYNIQSDPNVSTVMYQSFGGRYEGLAMAQSLLGQVIPSGRMSTSWYMSDDVLPTFDWQYSVPEGASDAYVNGGTDYVGYRFQKYDLTNADPQEAKLTYMYADPADVQYEFGYGININPDFYIPDDLLSMSAPATASADNTFNVAVSAMNVGVGNADGIEVFQLYAKKIDSAYGDAAPKNKLVAFNKVEMAAGSEANFTLTVDPQDLAIWDVNSGTYVVEEGVYELQLGYSAYDIRKTATITITGEGAAPIATLDPSEEFNVFDHSFAASDVVYREASKLRTVESLREQAIVGGYSVVMSKYADAYVAIPNVDFADGILDVVASVATNREAGNISVRLDSPTGTEIASIAVPVMGPRTYLVDGIADYATELDYADVTATNIAEDVTGVHNVYIVFDKGHLRIDSLTVDTLVTNYYDVTFNSNGGSAVASITDVAEGSTIEEPTAPTRTGYLFDGWYKDEDLTEAWNFETDVVEDDITLYAAWFELANKAVLSDAIRQAQAINPIFYTAESYADLQDALTDALALRDNQRATQDEVDTAATALLAAIDALEDAPIDTTALEALVNEMTQVLEETDKYTPDSLADLSLAIDAANAVLDDDDATQEDVEAAYNSLRAAYEALVEIVIVDKAELSDLIDDAKDIGADGWTAASYRALQDAITAAEAVLADDDATQKDVDDAVDALQAAIDALVELVGADKGDLADKVDDAKDIPAGNWTNESYKALQDAIEAAEVVLADDDATQQEVNDALTALQTAIDGLKEKEDPSTSNPSTSNPSTSKPTTTSTPSSSGSSSTPSARDYAILEGAGLTYTGAEDSIVIRSEGMFGKFKGLSIGGNALTLDTDYTAKDGSTIITILPAYLNTLANGTYSVVIEFEDGTSTTHIIVNVTSSTSSGSDSTDGTAVKTGDSNNGMFYIFALLALALSVTFVVVRKRFGRAV